uniref:Uncharacterized protein n=1 Tax=Solanum lycopersicum TaxID=4081 RepID=K4C0P3_SOLLC
MSAILNPLERSWRKEQRNFGKKLRKKGWR